MQSSIDKIVAHPWFVGMLAVTFVISMFGFWARIRRDERRRRSIKPGCEDTDAVDS
jgi:hypothetical protein